MHPMMVSKNIQKVAVDDVVRVYSGKPGCMCGCKGNYRSNPNHADADKDDKPNLAQVKRVLDVLKADPNVEYDEESVCYHGEKEGRKYVAYLTA